MKVNLTCALTQSLAASYLSLAVIGAACGGQPASSNAPAAPQPDPAVWKAELASAESMLKDRKFASSAAAFTKVLQTNAKAAAAHLGIAEAHVRTWEAADTARNLEDRLRTFEKQYGAARDKWPPQIRDYVDTNERIVRELAPADGEAAVVPSDGSSSGPNAQLELAERHLRQALDLSDDGAMRRRALESYAAIARPKGLNRREEAAALIRGVLDRHPNEAGGYIALATLHESFGDYTAAETELQRGRAAAASDPAMHQHAAAFYWGRADARQPTAPEAKRFIEAGIAAVDEALRLRPEYMEALTYKGLFLRLQARNSRDMKEVRALLDEADRLRDRAKALAQAAPASRTP